jgi:DNA sulfur modification protein DndE
MTLVPAVVRLGATDKAWMLTVRRRTGLPRANTVCRFAFTQSLADRALVNAVAAPTDTAMEIAWDTFGGHYADLYGALLLERVARDGLLLDASTVAQQLRGHVHRGLGYLVTDPNCRTLAGLLRRATGGQLRLGLEVDDGTVSDGV